MGTDFNCSCVLYIYFHLSSLEVHVSVCLEAHMCTCMCVRAFIFRCEWKVHCLL